MRTSSILAASFLVLGLACVPPDGGPADGGAPDSGEPAGAGRLVVAPSPLALGGVYLDDYLAQPVTLKNAGSAPLAIRRLVVEGDTAFSLVRAGMERALAPGESTQVTLVYRPTHAEDDAAVLRWETDDDAGEVEVTGHGEDSAPDLAITPARIALQGEAGCPPATENVCVENRGAGWVRLAAPVLSGDPAFELQWPWPEGQALRPGQEACVAVALGAEAPGAAQGALLVEASAVPRPLAAALSGEVVEAARVVETFEQLPLPMADLVLVVDNSASMADEQDALRSNLRSLAESAVMQMIDARILVVTTDGLVRVLGPDGRAWISSQDDPDFVERLVEGGVPAVLRPDEEAAHQGLAAALGAIRHPAAEDMFRYAGFLSVVVVSDGEDTSPEEPDYYLNAFWNVKGLRRKDLFSFSAIVSGAPVCESECGRAVAAGSRYLQVQQRTGGIFESVCACRWARSLEDVSMLAVGYKTTFFLRHEPRRPVTAHLEVTVRRDDGTSYVAEPRLSEDGQGEWWYDPEWNAIEFDPLSKPEPGNVVEVAYDLQCGFASGG